MSAKRDPDEEDGDFEEEEEDYLDDDDDDEEDFQPGDDDDDEDEDDSSKVMPLLDGTLSLDEEQKLHYKGDGFHLQSVTAVQWNLLDKAVKPESDSYTLEMVGSCDVLDYDTNEGDRTTSNSRKPTPRTVQVTWTVAPNTLSSSAAASNGKSRTKKSADDDEKDEDDGKMPSVFYLIHGREMNGMNRLEFKGGYLPTDGKQLKLLTEIRTVSQTQPQPAAAAAAHIDNDDDDDNINDIDDDGVDCDELIALHEDAGLSVDALRKRYRNTATTANSNDGDDEEATTAVSSKKRKGKSTPAAEEEEEEQGDDDDDIAF